MTKTNSFAVAFIAAQKEMGNAVKDSKNPFFKNSYADLNAIREACIPVLNNHGIAVLQPTVQIDGKNFVKTLLLHESGESMESLTEILFTKANDPQAQGSGITYARRYGLQSLVNVGAEDDDGNKAAESKKPEAPKKNAFGLSKDGDLAKGEDMKETQEASNKQEAERLIKEMKACPSISELLKVRTANKALTAKLFKYDKESFTKVLDAKNEKLFALMKRDIEESGSLAEMQGILQYWQSDIDDLATQAPKLAGMLNEATDAMKLTFI